MRNSSPLASELAQFAQMLADCARQISLRYFRQAVVIDAKSDATPVTIADRDIEKNLRQIINTHYPEHGIYGEELGVEKPHVRHVWVLDPIDGTRSFITGIPLFGTLISLLDNGRPILGVIDCPATGERWLGGQDCVTTCNAKPCHVSRCNQLRQSRLACTSPEMFNHRQRPAFECLQQHTAFYRFGGDCYNYALLASGHLDIVIEADLAPYDFCALVPVIESAGGVITDWQGEPLTLKSRGDVIAAASAKLHQQAIEKISSNNSYR